MTEVTLTREQVLAFRWRAHQLDPEAGSANDVDLLDLGVQDTGTGRSGRWHNAV